MDTILLLEWKAERTLLLEWPGGQGQEIDVIRIVNDDPEPQLLVNERGECFVGLFPPSSATERQQQKKSEASAVAKESQTMDIEAALEEKGNMDVEDKVMPEEKGSSSGRKYDSEYVEITLAETMELEVGR